MTVALFFISSGIMFSTSAIAFIFARRGVMQTQLTAFAAVAAVVGAYQVASAIYYQSESVSTSLFALKAQVTALFICFLSTYWFLCEYTQARIAPGFLTPLGIFSVLAIFLNWWLPASLRYEAPLQINAVTMPWGGLVYPFAGKLSQFGAAIYVYAVGLLVWMVYRGVLLFRRGSVSKARVVLLSCLTFFCSGVVGNMVDNGYWDFVYITGFSFVAVVMIFSSSLASELKEQKDFLAKTQGILQSTQNKQAELQADNALYGVLFGQLPMGIVVLNRQKRVIQANESAKQMGLIEPSTAGFWQITGVFKRRLIEQGLKRVFTGEVVKLVEMDVSQDLNLQHPHWLSMNLYPVRRDDHEEVVEVALFAEDANAQYKQKRALTQIASGVSLSADEGIFQKMVVQLSALFDSEYAFIAVINADDDQTFAETLAVSHRGEIIDNFRYALLNTPCSTVGAERACIYASDVQTIFPKDQMLRDMDIESYVGVPMHSASGCSKGLVVILDTKPMSALAEKQAILDIFAVRAGAELEKIETDARIRRLAYEDDVTKLPNRSQLNLELASLFENSAAAENETDKITAVLFQLDIDYFKSINESFGHELGDRFLHELATRLRSRYQDQAFIARSGGDEFMFIGRDFDHSQAVQFADQILNAIQEPLEVAGNTVTLSASMGFVEIPKFAEREIDALKCAELAVHEAKTQGRNRFRAFDEHLQQSSQRRLMIKKEIKHAIASDQFQLYVQPQVNCDGIVVGGECLIRWIHPQRGLMSPADFIPIAEESGVIHQLGYWVIERACQYLVEWREYTAPLSINISARQLANPDFESGLLNLIEKYGVEPRRLILEVTESTFLHDVEASASIFGRLQARGFAIALDDFGTGYSSLAYLRDLPLNELKIDRAFVSAMTDARSFGLLRSIFTIAGHMNLSVVAEGVETRDQHEKLIDLGCDRFQGFHFSKPLPPDIFVQWEYPEIVS